MTSPEFVIEKFWPLLPLFFVGMWLLVSFIISKTGWSSFSTRYPALHRPEGRKKAAAIVHRSL